LALPDKAVISQLRVVHNIVCSRGGDKHSLPNDPLLVIAADILTGVIEALERVPPMRRQPGSTYDHG